MIHIIKLIQRRFQNQSRKIIVVLTVICLGGLAVGLTLLFQVYSPAPSPYLEDDLRLQDILAAIQIMGVYKWDSRSEAEWTKVLGEPRSVKTKRWEDIFKRHPEFFGIEKSKILGKKMSLRWRRAYQEIYDTMHLKTLTIEEKEKLQAVNGGQRIKFSRPPLEAEEIQILLASAIELHARAVAAAERRRWLVTILLPATVSSTSALVGVLLGAWLGRPISHKNRS